ncbi:MAG: hypothetical protein KGR26_08275 [Cyanobacteria bacterium REEB65]|nr:hypothetical protein [Cyanobacteria bacterium REEB65]
MNFLADIFRDERNQPSSTRVVFVAAAIVILGIIVAMAVATKSIPDVPQNFVVLLLGLAGSVPANGLVKALHSSIDGKHAINALLAGGASGDDAGFPDDDQPDKGTARDNAEPDEDTDDSAGDASGTDSTATPDDGSAAA